VNARHSDPIGEDHSGDRHDICLKDREWREVHDFIAGTSAYRKSLDADLKGIKGGMWAVALTVLLPFVTGLIWIGGIGEQVKQHGKEITEIKQDMKEFRRK
jgi:hypothetical protein